jgi:hypothetical protein
MERKVVRVSVIVAAGLVLSWLCTYVFISRAVDMGENV